MRMKFWPRKIGREKAQKVQRGGVAGLSFRLVGCVCVVPSGKLFEVGGPVRTDKSAQSVRSDTDGS